MVRPRVLLADDNLELLEAESFMLAPYFELVGTVRDGESLISAVQQLHPDVVVVDIAMPVKSGIEAVHQLSLSGTGAGTAFVFLTIHSEEEFINACLAEGACGYVFKSQMGTHLIPAIYSALRGDRYVSPRGVV